MPRSSAPSRYLRTPAALGQRAELYRPLEPTTQPALVAPAARIAAKADSLTFGFSGLRRHLTGYRDARAVFDALPEHLRRAAWAKLRAEAEAWR